MRLLVYLLVCLLRASKSGGNVGKFRLGEAV
jgi:hypothetical protein